MVNVKIGVSNRHIHLCKEDYKILFGDTKMEKVRDLVQTGQFASNLVVEVSTKKNTIEKVRLIGPLRDYTQVEVSKTDCYMLGIDAPVRDSGDLHDASEVTIRGPFGSLTKKCAIVANRHLHLNHNDRVRLGLLDVSKISVEVGNIKTAILNDVYIKETDKGVLELHLDTDDANGNFLSNGDSAILIIK